MRPDHQYQSGPLDERDRYGPEQRDTRRPSYSDLPPQGTEPAVVVYRSDQTGNQVSRRGKIATSKAPPSSSPVRWATTLVTEQDGSDIKAVGILYPERDADNQHPAVVSMSADMSLGSGRINQRLGYLCGVFEPAALRARMDAL